MAAKRVIAITGASAGIGRATAIRVARDGAAVAICARRADRLQQVAGEVRAAGGEALPIVADVTRETDMEQFVAATVGSHIRVTVVYPVSTDSEFFDVMSHQTGTAVTRASGPRQSVETVADAIARAIDRPTAEVYPHFTSRLLVVLNALAPGFTDRVVQRFGRKPAR